MKQKEEGTSVNWSTVLKRHRDWLIREVGVSPLLWQTRPLNRSRTIRESPSYVTTVNGPSWMRQGEQLAAGNGGNIPAVPWRSRRTCATWWKTPKSKTRMLLEVLGSLHSHRSGIGLQLQIQTVMATTVTAGFRSYHQDPQPLWARPASPTEW